MRWTKEQERLLISLYGKCTLGAIAAKLGLSYTQVQTKLDYLKTKGQLIKNEPKDVVFETKPFSPIGKKAVQIDKRTWVYRNSD